MSRTLPLCLLLVCAVPASAAEKTAFDGVAPVFEQHCVRCHSGSEPKGGLDLTTRKALDAGGESGAALVAGKPDESLLVEYVSGEKPEMPKDAPPLSAEHVASIRRWIAEGAAWPEGAVLKDRHQIDANWWSLAPLAKVEPPALDEAFVRTPIDAFVLAKLREQKLEPSPAADRRTLVRRLTYDLHGLPPTPEEVDAFEADASDDAYRNLVDRLLASPRYGERWGRHWLDIVHFGESHGYDKDKPRPNAWPYRDYVIRSLNDDKPYDRFVAEQIAGDVLYGDDPQAIVGTGFVAAGPWDFVGHVELREGTVDKDIARSNDRDDMLAGAMSTFTSLTVHCARCHDHKFDPIKQADYYALQAVFAGVDRADRPYDPDPDVARRRAELGTQKRKLDEALAALRKRVETITSPEIEALDALVKLITELAKELPAEAASQTLGYHSQIEPKADTTKWVQVDLGVSVPIDEVVLVPAHVKFGGHAGPGFGFPPQFKVEISDAADFATREVVCDHTGEEFPHPGDAWQRFAAAGKRARYVRVTATRLWKRTDDWIFALGELAVLSGGENAAFGKPVTALDSIEAAPSWATVNLVDGYSSLARVAAADGLHPSRRTAVDDTLRKAAKARKRRVAELIDDETKASLEQTERALTAVETQLAALPTQPMVYAAASRFTAQGAFTQAEQPRPIHLLARGDVRNRGPLVAPGAVAAVRGPDAQFVLSDPANEGQRRAALAGWLVDPRNALVRRSIVNRVWQYHFGRGIVDSPNDFGRMGALPTHPELLDWLAGWFADHGHSLKQLHRLILMSSTYRQQSQSRASAEAIDAANRYLWRMNRTRLDAECVRDAVLFVSGQLDLTMGGPSVQQFLFKDDHSPIYDYGQFDVDDPRSRRRSVYRFLVRSVPDPFMDCLDCADPSIMTPKRNTTLTSIQALALLNNPLVVRQAEHFAERLRGEHATVSAQIEAAYRLALARSPREAEAQALARYVEQHGLANVCRLIFNTNEFLFVD